MAVANPSGVNGPRMGKTHGRLRNTVINIASKRRYPSSVGPPRGGGSPAPALVRGAVTAPATVPVLPSRSAPVTEQPAPNLAPFAEQMRAAQEQSLRIQQLMSQLASAKKAQPAGPGGKGMVPAGRNAVERQLIQGFQAANRPDLAKMVSTPEFRTWVGQESGWRPDAVSGPINQGLVNYGLFQFWAGHPWTKKFVDSGEWVASPRQQARLVARYFSHLTPARIREYARQIQAGTYKGWG